MTNSDTIIAASGSLGSSAYKKPVQRPTAISGMISLVILILLGSLASAESRISAAPAPTTQPAVSPAQTQPATTQPDLLSYGNSDDLWVARVMPTIDPPGTETQVDSRSAGAEAWQHLTEVPARATDLASFGGQLAVLLEDGTWILPAPDGDASGQPLPNNAPILALASDADRFLALGLAPTPTTREAATTAPATTEPATQPAESHIEPALALYVSKDNTWTPFGGPPLPEDITPGLRRSLAIIDRVPYLAIERPDGVIDVIRQTPAKWETVAHIPAKATPRPFKLLSGFTPPAIWIAGQPSDELIIFPPGRPQKTIPLSDFKASLADRTAVYFAHYIRDMAFVDGKFVEHDYNEKFEPAGGGEASALPTQTTPALVSPLFRTIMIVLLALAIFTSARRRRDGKDVLPGMESLVLADLGRRLAAGLIDAVPLMVPAYFVLQNVNADAKRLTPSSDADQSQQMLSVMISLAGLLVYLIHTAATETLTGRTVGKMILGLRVVNLDGSTPDASSLLIRNFLRIVDIGLAGVTLAFILFSPLRQRIGDVAAGTVVVRDRVRPEGNLVEPPKTEDAVAPSSVEPPAAEG